MQPNINSGLAEQIHLNKGIRQRDSLGRLLLKFVMN